MRRRGCDPKSAPRLPNEARSRPSAVFRAQTNGRSLHGTPLRLPSRAAFSPLNWAATREEGPRVNGITALGLGPAPTRALLHSRAAGARHRARRQPPAPARSLDHCATPLVPADELPLLYGSGETTHNNTKQNLGSRRACTQRRCGTWPSYTGGGLAT